MSRITLLSPRRSFVAAGLAGALALTLGAAPAQAAYVTDAAGQPVQNAQDANFYIPAGKTAHIVFEDFDNNNAATFPAGTYLVTKEVIDAKHRELAGMLPDAGALSTSTHSVVRLDAPGPITVDLTETGRSGTSHVVVLSRIPDDFGDPATMTPEQIAAAITAAEDAGLTGNSFISLEVANIPDAAGLELGPGLFDADETYLADFFGIGVDTLGYRIGNRFVATAPGGEVMEMRFGRATDEALIGDWDGDGADSIGVRRGNTVFLDDDWNGGWAEHSFTFGRAADDMLAGDWDGDGTDTLAIRRGNVFHVTNAHKSGWAQYFFSFGRATDYPIVGDWDGDGADSISVTRPDTPDSPSGTLYISDNGGKTVATYPIVN